MSEPRPDYRTRAQTIADKAGQAESPFRRAGLSLSNPVADWIASGRIVAYHADFGKITGSASSALLLSQMWYWSHTETSEQREGWFWLTQAEITEQTNLTRWEQESARKTLRDKGILLEKREGIPLRLWFRLDKERFFALILEYLHKESQREEIKEEL